jgi:hypothetical protein
VQSRDCQRRSNDVRQFLELYYEWAATLIPGDGFQGGWTSTRESLILAPRVAEAGARAAAGFDAAGVGVQWKRPGTFQTVPVNPGLVWSTLTDSLPMVTPELMQIVGAQAIGRLDSLAVEAAERERGLAGFLARFIRFPQRVREAAGLPARSVRGGVVTGFVALLQTVVVGIVVGAIGSALAIPIAKLFGWM